MANKMLAVTRQDAIDRGKKDATRNVNYNLSSGGYDCSATYADQGGLCDCTGFLAHALGTDRQTNQIPGGWLESTMIFNDATGTQEMFEKVSTPQAGDIVCYGDNGGEGHVGLISAVSNGTPTYCIHCNARTNPATVNEPWSVWWGPNFNKKGAIFARYLFYTDGEDGDDLEVTKVIIDGVAYEGRYDPKTNTNYPPLTPIKPSMVSEGYGFEWDGKASPKKLTIYLPADVKAAIATVEAAGYSVKRREPS